jgi:hypothetical protein
MFVVTLQA